MRQIVNSGANIRAILKFGIAMDKNNPKLKRQQNDMRRENISSISTCSGKSARIKLPLCRRYTKVVNQNIYEEV